MTYTKGGRGIKAPYETTHVRIPLPLKSKVQGMIDTYKESLDVDLALASLVKVEDPINPLTGNDTEKLLTRNEAIELARDILLKKKSARVSMSKLLTAIYGEDIVL